jgi:Tfp pilus assembly protein PilV
MTVPPHRRSAPAPRGFGLIEVLVSGTMLAVGLAGIVSFAGQANAALGHQRHLTVAGNVAERQMEALLTLYADDARLTDGDHTGSTFDTIGAPGAGPYTTSWVVEAGVPVPGARRITVTVSWQEGAVTKTTRLRTVRT